MTNTQTQKKTTARFNETVQQYYDLTKPRVVMLIVFTAFVGMLLAVPGIPNLTLVFWASLGIGLAASSGAAMNQIIDIQADAKMARTKNRPLPQGNVKVWQAIAFAVFLTVASMLILIKFVNPLTAILTFASMVGYGLIYTVFLKPATPLNIVTGGAAGAAPPLLGWAAMTNVISPQACLLFLIIFTWTPPHFWALALYKREEYAKADVPMLPVTHGERYTLLQIVLYTIVMVVVTLMPFAIGMFGLIYLLAAVILNAIFLKYVITLYSNYSDELSKKTFIYSIQYLAYIFAAMLIDHYVSPFVGI